MKLYFCCLCVVFLTKVEISHSLKQSIRYLQKVLRKVGYLDWIALVEISNIQRRQSQVFSSALHYAVLTIFSLMALY